MPIKILPSEIVSKIAAGEVIERPASVIKELLENALDAGATDIRIELKDAGKQLIHIRDNGHGIQPCDLENLFHRHATSKINSVDDLYNIRSLGFRGEGLYSIAAISDITLKTRYGVRSLTKHEERGTRNDKDQNRPSDEVSGLPSSNIEIEPSVVYDAWEIHVKGGERLHLRPSVLNGTGTEIAVRELFFNTPARRKFLKSNSAEINAILNILIPYFIFYPGHYFYLEHDARVLIDTPPADSMTMRFSHILKIDSNSLIEAEHEFKDKQFSCRIVCGDINLSRTRKDMQFIFVNGRPVQSKNIAFHVNEVYRLVLPPGSNPVFALMLDILPEDIDANVHPTKREVKVRNEQAICSALRHFIESLIMTKSKPRIIAVDEDGQPERNEEAGYGFKGSDEERETYRMESNYPEIAESLSEYSRTALPSEEYTVPQTNAQEQAEFFIQSAGQQEGKDLRAKLTAANYIGQFRNKYLLFESGTSLLLVDQHAAQERIVFEQLITNMLKGNSEVQHLLTPVVIKLTAQSLLQWEDLKDDLEAIGFASSQLDNESIAIHTAPVLIKDIECAVTNSLAGDRIPRHDHESLARRACRGSVMSGQRLTPEQSLFQREQLLQCLNPFTCPHGRPTVIEIDENFLNKQFLRT
jgi:DNA mismatch repair protein MutL